MPEFGTSIVNKKNCYRVFGVLSVITITALIVVIIKSNPSEGSSLSDDNTVESGVENQSPPEDCYPEPDGTIHQFIIGFGSLMQTASKLRTYPDATENIPVYVHGFSRHWNIQGKTVGFSTTYLGVQKKDSATINAVIFQMPRHSQSDLVAAIAKYDKRERFYCRIEVPRDKIEILNKTDELDMLMNSTDKSAQFWIYYNRPENSKAASARYPIVQSYVDIFLSGCIELEDKFELKKFAEKCVLYTYGWSSYWVNDRILPRRPFANTPMAGKIDALLASLIPDIFKTIKIEG